MRHILDKKQDSTTYRCFKTQMSPWLSQIIPKSADSTVFLFVFFSSSFTSQISLPLSETHLPKRGGTKVRELAESGSQLPESKSKYGFLNPITY